MVTQPTQPDHSSYPDSAVPGVAPADFRLGGDGLPPEAIAKVHERFLAYLTEKRATFLGYQIDLERGREREYSHIYIMGHVTADLVDALVRDLSRPDAFPDGG